MHTGTDLLDLQEEYPEDLANAGSLSNLHLKGVCKGARQEELVCPLVCYERHHARCARVVMASLDKQVSNGVNAVLFQ